MKTCLVLFSLIVASTASIIKINEDYRHQLKQLEEPRIEISAIKDIIDQVVAFLKQYDPIQIDSKTLFDQYGYQINVSNVRFEGFSNIISKADLNPFPTIIITFELGMTEVLADVQLWEANTPLIFGTGGARIHIKNAKISIIIEHIILEGFQPSQVITSIESAEASITGVNNSESLSKKISDFLEYLLNDVVNSSELHQMLSRLVDEIIENIL